MKTVAFDDDRIDFFTGKDLLKRVFYACFTVDVPAPEEPVTTTIGCF